MSDLTDRMRTCAAFILSTNDKCETDPASELLLLSAMLDAADLLIEASNVIEAIPEPLGEPMAILEPPPATAAKPATEQVGTWVAAGDFLPRPGDLGLTNPVNPRTCPKCDSRAAKRVFRNGTELYLACPVCAHAWPYQANLP